jgi:peptidoglycan/LPS O-acetylase OafA/YrhL
VNDSPAASSARLPQLDALRATAAVFVLLYHYDMAFVDHPTFQHGWMAVDFFFLLSGFVLSAAVGHRCHDLRSGLTFVAERIGRLWPIMAVGTLIGFAVLLAYQGANAGLLLNLGLALLFIPGWTVAQSIFPLNAPQWSLMFELVANAVHALFFSRLRTRMLLILAGTSWLGLAAVAYSKGEIAYGPMCPGWQIAVLRIGFAYTVGCAMGRYHEQIARRFKAPWWVSISLLSLLLLRPGREQLIDGAWDLATLLAFPLVLALGVSARPPRALQRPMSVAGAASWPLYAFHDPMLHLAMLLTAKGVVTQSVAAPLAALLAIALAFYVGPSRLAKGIKLPLMRPRTTGLQMLTST